MNCTVGIDHTNYTNGVGMYELYMRGPIIFVKMGYDYSKCTHLVWSY